MFVNVNGPFFKVGKSLINRFYQLLLLYYIAIDNDLTLLFPTYMAKNKSLVSRFFEEVTDPDNPFTQAIGDKYFLLLTEFFVVLANSKIDMYLVIIDRLRENPNPTLQ